MNSVYLPAYSLHQPQIRRQPLHTVKLISGEPSSFLSLQQNKVTADHLTPEAVHGKMKLGIIIFYCVDKLALEWNMEGYRLREQYHQHQENEQLYVRAWHLHRHHKDQVFKACIEDQSIHHEYPQRA